VWELLGRMAPLIGGLGLFLLGMRMMTEGLKLAVGDALAALLRAWTKSPIRGLLAGALLTALVQHSGMVTVATIGFVNAGLLTLAEAVWLVFGANVGTTMTAWLVALVGVKVDPSALALPVLGAGMLLSLGAMGRPRLAAAGEALAGFGAFFLGVAVLQTGFAGVTETWDMPGPEAVGLGGVLLFTGIGAILTVLTQSSSAALAIILTATVGGAAPLMLAAAAVIGANVGSTSTALFAAVGATAAARRVAVAHIVFNLVTAAAALAGLPLLLSAADAIADTLRLGDNPAIRLAVFHTLFNCLGVALIAPFAASLVRRLSRLFVAADDLGRVRHLDSTLLSVPQVALHALALELERLRSEVFGLLSAQLQGRPLHDQHARLEALAGLAGAARGFITDLSGRAPPADVVARLADLLRALQHLEELIGLARAWRRAPAAPPEVVAQIDRIEALAATALVRVDGAETAVALYEEIKRLLLTKAAAGAMPVPAAEAALAQALWARRCVERADKAMRRLRAGAPPDGLEPAGG